MTFPIESFEEGGTRWQADPTCRDQLRPWLRAFFPGVLERPDALRKDAPESRVAAHAGLVLKRTSPRGGWGRTLRRSAAQRARRAARLAWQLSRQGVPVAHALAWGRGPGNESYLVTREICPARPLAEWLQDASLRPKDRQHLLRSLGRLLGKFHHAGFSNRDLKDTNILIRGQHLPDDAVAIDLDGVRRRRLIHPATAIRDFWPLLHSLAVFGWDTPEARHTLFEAYARTVPTRLRPDDLSPRSQPLPCRIPQWRGSRIRIGWSGRRRRTLDIFSPEPHEEWVQRLHAVWLHRLRQSHLNRMPAEEPVPLPPQRGETHPAAFDLVRFPTRFHGWTLIHVFRPSRAARILRTIQSRNPAVAHPERRPVVLIEERIRGYGIASGIVFETTASLPATEPCP